MADGRLEKFELEYQRSVEEMSDPKLFQDQHRAREVARRHKALEEIVATLRDIDQLQEDLSAATEFYQAAPADERSLWADEISTLESALAAKTDELEILLLPQDPNDGRNVILEIRGAEGGEEANLFAKDLTEMFQRFGDKMGWRVEMLAADPSDHGGYNFASLLVKGEDAWRRLKHEAGPHRVQRVPVTETQGRVHTSSATVTVLPEADEVEVQIDPNDLRIDVYRSTGPGGQSVNTTDSAVRITHIPTGIVVAMQDEKSQIQNRAKALQVLRARLLKAEQDRVNEELSRTRKSQVGGGGRSEKIRTYNFKENRVTDHRIKLTLYRLDQILMGDLLEISDALIQDERSRQLLDQDDAR
ncbi:peptide chain release factor 1 [Ferrimicrobium acidiphilum]|uniref:Peptide chain release factor 1 n=1 Tax=Ferrimicrobium acidiphilum DSM 19497 TaxID=1121877 RepID=A0A0D8FWB2_9ACTN|nr:peptide chain release factor 1 [Ferrimicrobium acidiphilum]KJE77580.1 peptide chain release factor 1 [Ferrimicrobium acidiphilum DSM 19497]MCL5053672.1 peptide chain release factor 1 [Gammaproteobacteria bacterium]